MFPWMLLVLSLYIILHLKCTFSIRKWVSLWSEDILEEYSNGHVFLQFRTPLFFVFLPFIIKYCLLSTWQNDFMSIFLFFYYILFIINTVYMMWLEYWYDKESLWFVLIGFWFLRFTKFFLFICVFCSWSLLKIRFRI